MKKLFVMLFAAMLFFASPINAYSQDKTPESYYKVSLVCGVFDNCLTRIRVNTIGKGDDVILIPGLGSPPAVFDNVMDEIAKNHKVHIIHVAGYAGLPLETNEGPIFNPVADDITKYIKQNNLKNVTIIGHSMGGELGMALAVRNPSLVKKVMVIDALPYYSLYLDKNATPESMTPRAKAFAAMIAAQNIDQFTAAQKVAIARLVKSDEKREMVLGWSLASNRHAIAQGVEDLMTIDLRPELKNNQAQIKLIYGYDKAMGLPQEFVDKLYDGAYAGIPNVEKQRIDNSLHFIMYDQPEQFKNAVLEFVK